MKNFFLLIILFIIVNLYIFNFSVSINDYRNKTNSIRKKSVFRFSKSKSANFNDLGNAPQSFQDVFKMYNIVPSRLYTHANLIMFTLLVDYQDLYHDILAINSPINIYSLLSIDMFANKAKLFEILSQNNNLYIHYLPETYILQKKESISKLQNNFDKSILYILKKNIQRQKGCTITNNLNFILSAKHDNYVVCQKLLQNPYTVNGHKINIRQYLIIFVKQNQCTFKLFNDGFMYYTPKKFKKNSLDKDRHITTGYIDREIYTRNPMTVKNFKDTELSREEVTFFEKNLLKLFQFVKKQYTPTVLNLDSNQHNNFAILGCDIAVCDNLECILIEINKGPDLSYKDIKDSAVKKTLVSCVLNDIGFIKYPHNNLIYI